MNNDLHFGSSKDDWRTPRALFDRLNAEFGFEVDVAASEENALCARYFTEEDDGLSHRWKGVVWCNPPYGKGIERWIEKGMRSAADGSTVVILVPARTDSRWMNALMECGAEIRFLGQRLHFDDGPSAAPFPSCIVVLRPSDVEWASDDPDATFVMRGYRKGPTKWYPMRTTAGDSR